jgi:hypothetical protein
VLGWNREVADARLGIYGALGVRVKSNHGKIH